ncbi:MAG: DUF4294 domain-containing protein [Chitinophagales bacterium]|jgi:hypothetical protein|nr:DUF4294 domain-containing protein [Chitinophagales bacterium]
MNRIFTLLFVSLYGSAMAQNADTVLSFSLPRVTVDAKRNWDNDTVRYKYNQMRYYVTTILPYLDAATAMMNELNRKEHDPNISRRERKDFVNRKEEEIRQRFENEISKLNETQGVLLVKLIARQSGENIYGKMEEYKNTFYAMKWQAWARFHGFNLNKRYDPYEEPMLEHIMQSLGYELPAKYGEYEARLNTH